MRRLTGLLFAAVLVSPLLLGQELSDPWGPCPASVHDLHRQLCGSASLRDEHVVPGFAAGHLAQGDLTLPGAQAEPDTHARRRPLVMHLQP